MKYIMIMVLLGIIGAANAQYSKKDIVRYLTNDNFRTWLFKDYKVTLGNSCTGEGQSLEFYKNGKLGWKRCVDGKPLYQEVKWNIEEVPNAPGEFTINFDKRITFIEGESFKVIRINMVLPQLHKRSTKMIWNNPSDCKACPEAIIEFLSKN